MWELDENERVESVVMPCQVESDQNSVSMTADRGHVIIALTQMDIRMKDHCFRICGSIYVFVCVTVQSALQCINVLIWFVTT